MDETFFLLNNENNNNIKCNINIITPDEKIIEEEGKSTEIKSNYKEGHSIKKSERHVKTLFLWTKVAKANFEKSDKRLASDDGKLKYSICTNTSNKNVSLVINSTETKKEGKIKTNSHF